jgi:hypothetical protein
LRRWTPSQRGTPTALDQGGQGVADVALQAAGLLAGKRRDARALAVVLAALLEVAGTA